MKTLLKAASFLGSVTLAIAAPKVSASSVEIDHDPKSVAEFHKLVRTAAANGAVQVQFPSGEWNWYCSGHTKLIEKASFSKWESKNESIDLGELGTWLTDKNVEAVQIFLDPDLNITLYFGIERFLRSRNIQYWVVSADATPKKTVGIRLIETDGRFVEPSEDGANQTTKKQNKAEEPTPNPPSD